MRQPQPSDAILDRLLSLHPKIIDLVLDRVWRLLASLGNPERVLPPVVHIAGTNGKGSTLAMLRAGLESTDQRVHAYTSPHLARFHERIRLAGRLIAEPDLVALLEECEQANDGAPITFFEITTVAAFLAFARTQADWCLLEVGLGGRLDATNVVDQPTLTVITPVSYDHQQYLGETLPEIAREKAGILKPGVPCIVGPQSDAAMDVIETRAAEIGAPLLVANQDWSVRQEHGRLVFQDDRGLLDLDPPRLIGSHQIDNAGVAVAALRALGHGDGACQAALVRAEWPARMQRLKTGPLVDTLSPGSELWLDGGHNAAAGQAIAGVLSAWGERTDLIVGMLDTKSAVDFLEPLEPHSGLVRTVTIPGAQASYDAEALSDLANRAGLSAKPAESVKVALADIVSASDEPRRVLICGSLYLAGHILTDHG